MRFSLSDLIHDEPPSPTSQLSSNGPQDTFNHNRLTETIDPFLANHHNEGLSIRPPATAMNLLDQFAHRQEQQTFQSVHGPSVPAARIFDGTAHLRGAQNTSEPPAYQSSVQSNEVEVGVGQNRDNSPMIPIQIEFTFYLPTEEPARPGNPRKRPPPTSNEPRPEKKVNSDPDRMRVYWDPRDNDLNRFKDEAIQAIGEKEGEPVAVFARSQDAAGNIDWCVSIPFGGPFAANHKRRLDNPEVFSRFLTAAEGASDDRKAMCRLVQKDPKAAAEKASAYKRLRQTQSGSNTDGGDNEPEVVPTASESSGAELTRLIRDILTAHDPCEQLSGSSEKPVFINPENRNEFFVITFPKADAWARAIKANPKEVNILTPPRSPLFRFQKAGSNASPAVIQSAQPTLPPPTPPAQQAPNMFSMYPPPWAWQYGFNQPFPQSATPPVLSTPVASTSTSQTEAPVIESSPAPSDGTSNLDDFLRFARVNVDSVALTEGLHNLGITHWSMFQLTSAEELVDAGVPPVSARSLLRAVRRYSKMKKNDTSSK
ncbi:hypothetical protein PGT21_034900 [Puccinia graminis f. sp. tritici]|uniref:Uncharacterized protein n=1 Tax=Puccinia graminis f. sp. tritici TaxID=56615 RepID=A0A5B0P2X6_PUCGR|nr:hypothetical protein PGT21_034900 [Puccinia graminis f. sp. tritici]KAA1121311.1 hypothetical protein PGTUg99_002390 [Puccinia graminis f. sp. tritici]